MKTEEEMQHVRLHSLYVRQENDEWIVGRIDTGNFVALPPVGAQAVELLRRGLAIDVVSQRLGHAVDVRHFVASLIELGFVAEIDGTSVADEPPPVSFGCIKKNHVQWILHPVISIVISSIIVAGLVLIVLNPSQVPGPRDVLWSQRGSLVIITQIFTTWGSIFLHELAHLFTARAAGVTGKIRLGTRLQFLCAQTDVSGIWAAPRLRRIAVYISGMALNAMLASGAMVLILLTGSGIGHTAGALIFLTQTGLLIGQFFFFMRTDVYFIVQDVARCRNLYGDATSYVKYILNKIARRPAANPMSRLSPRERKVVRLYTVFFVPGIVASITFFAMVTLPILAALLKGAAEHLASSHSPEELIDAAIVIVDIVGLKILWGHAWWRRHGHRVRARLRLSSLTEREKLHNSEINPNGD